MRKEPITTSLLREDEIFLTEQQLAARHQRSVKTLRNARVHGGYVKFVKLGRNVRYRFSDVLAYEEANIQRSTSELISPKQFHQS
jgi:hypothetical protein